MEKKLLFSLIIFLTIITNTFSQVASFDAQNLSKTSYISGAKIKFNPKDSLQILPILLNYVTPKPKTFDELGNALSGNPYIDIIGSASMAIHGTSVNINASAKNNVLSTPVTDIADGLAKFLIKRAKQELLISFFNNLRDSDKNPEFVILFPNTKLLVDNFESWEYANIINTLKEALNKDLKQLLGNIPNLVNLNTTNKKYTAEVKKRVTAIQAFFSSDDGKLFCASLNIGNGFITGQKIPDIIHSITGPNSLASISTLTSDEKNVFKLLDILSYSIRSNEYGKSYISYSDFSGLSSDTKKIFLGLLYQQLKNENIEISGVKLYDFLQTNSPKIENFVINLISNSDAITDAYNKLSEAKKKGETDLTPYWSVIFENANSFFQTTLNSQSIDSRFKFSDNFKTVLNLSTNTLGIASEISSKNYNAAIVSTLNLISENIKTKNGDEFKAFFVKYGSFAANVVEAQNSDEVEEAIESVALPVGSASIKKKTCFNIALNAYLGGFYGNEYLADKSSNKWATISGVYAPVGVAFSWGINQGGTGCKVGDFFFKGFSLTGLINIIDIGAVASFRLQDTTTEKLPEVTLQNILAPGLGVVYGLPNFPLSIGYTYQLGPTLRNITPEAATVSPQLNRRWQFFIGVDIPIFNFYTKSK